MANGLGIQAQESFDTACDERGWWGRGSSSAEVAEGLNTLSTQGKHVILMQPNPEDDILIMAGGSIGRLSAQRGANPQNYIDDYVVFPLIIVPS